MKRTKKLASLLLALGLTLSLSAPAFAVEETGGTDPAPVETATAIAAKSGVKATITAPSGDRTYSIYQIFAGDLSEGVLSNVLWGANAASGHTPGDAVTDDELQDLVDVNVAGKTDVEKLAAIEQYVDLTGSPVATITNSGTAEVPTGYYLIKDNGPANDGKDFSLYVVELVGNITITPKSGTTTSEKKVDDKNDSNTEEDATNWQDSADYDIGDSVPFKLEATITDKFNDYTKYKLTFHDVEEAGLSFDKGSVKVYLDTIDDNKLIDASNYIIKTGEDVHTPAAGEEKCTFEVAFDDLTTVKDTSGNAVTASSKIIVTYNSTLNDQAVHGSTGNKNTMHITYSNNPNDEQGGEGGKTPDDTVIVFTFKTIVNKVTKNPAYVEGTSPEEDKYIELKGADFELYKFIPKTDGVDEHNSVKGEWTKVERGHDEKWSEDITTFTFSGLDAGDYKLHESKTPDGYNTVADIEFTITATHEVLADDPRLTSLDGGNKLTGEVTTGELVTDVENNKGTELPTTGGMGTTVLYIAGGVMVAAAGILLITKKRMSK